MKTFLKITFDDPLIIKLVLVIRCLALINCASGEYYKTWGWMLPSPILVMTWPWLWTLIVSNWIMWSDINTVFTLLIWGYKVLYLSCGATKFYICHMGLQSFTFVTWGYTVLHLSYGATQFYSCYMGPNTVSLLLYKAKQSYTLVIWGNTQL